MFPQVRALINCAPPGTRTPNPRIKSRESSPVLRWWPIMASCRSFARQQLSAIIAVWQCFHGVSVALRARLITRTGGWRRGQWGGPRSHSAPTGALRPRRMALATVPGRSTAISTGSPVRSSATPGRRGAAGLVDRHLRAVSVKNGPGTAKMVRSVLSGMCGLA